MGARIPTYKVNICFAKEKSQDEVEAAYTQFYVSVFSRAINSSTAPLEIKTSILDKIIAEHRCSH